MNAVAVEIIALLTILALSGCARAARCDAERTPKIAVRTTSMKTFEEPWADFEALYRDDVVVICSAGDALSLKIQKGTRNLGMIENGTYLNTEEVNSTTVRYEIGRPNVGRYRYRCVDTISRCEDNLYLIIRPVMSVISAIVHYKVDEGGNQMFFVPHGATYQILCTGSDVESLSIENTRTSEKLSTNAVNETTVSHEARAGAAGVTYCSCLGEETQSLVLVVGYPLEAQQFRCTSYNWNKIACSWRSPSTTYRFNLYYTDPYGDTKLLCHELLDGMNRVCAWNNMRVTDLKLDRVSRSAVVTWRAHEYNWIYKYIYKVEYRLLASRWRQVNGSLVTCSHIECGIDLNLECPDQHYELRVFVRYKEAAEERLWSEPASTYFFTSSQNADDTIDPVCLEALQEPEPITSTETALSEIGKLVRHTLKSNTALKKKMVDLRLKLAKIKALRDWLADSSAEMKDSAT